MGGSEKPSEMQLVFLRKEEKKKNSFPNLIFSCKDKVKVYCLIYKFVFF